MIRPALAGLALLVLVAHPATAGDDGRPLGTGVLSYYCVARESPGPRDTTLCTTKGKPLARVTRKTALAARLQGTLLLEDARLLNVAGGPCPCAFGPCFLEVDRQTHPFGLGARGNPLVPYRTVAVDPKRIPLGARLFVPGLLGLPIPAADGLGTTPHDGCVTAGDVGGGVDGLQIDFFVGACSKDHPARRLPKHTRVHRDAGRCRSAPAG